jgi:hypothetical protein
MSCFCLREQHHMQETSYIIIEKAKSMRTNRRVHVETKRDNVSLRMQIS